MPYVSRDGSGKIVAVHAEPTAEAREFVPPGSSDLNALLGADPSTGDPHGQLVASDLAMVRVVEDLIDVLIEKNVIMLTDLPPAAQTKLMSRRNLRGQLSGLVGLVNDDQDL